MTKTEQWTCPVRQLSYTVGRTLSVVQWYDIVYMYTHMTMHK